ncbi:DUF6311 domain-containing protein [Pseudomonas nunensis]|uniref:DUF6311 domain-containing protein n=1 Tax=Pseudomonas nunensis TaxID=2961896 RepID=A0ABY5EBG4_9PSED|nr:DUF6311 domain-containing protein [Pseudomonas nunensis]KPN92267.1 hypothetical protein AL066_18735 [Pseudomonas nunensis]MCL5227056.1 DUF6311 domain-containing protein [Pseudomonas nunensis]UTO12491.1 DUF6311 domain-containing protein [Pseudomonas nunensis]
MKDSGKHWALELLPLLMGVLAFFIVIGPRALDPQNIAWLDSGDPATHYLGWVFFRHSPWTFPLGLNPSYGLELGSSIIFSDSNPLLALLFKPFNAWLPETFQYFGIWLMACFVLQAWFAWKLVGLVTPNVALKLLGAGLFLFSPPMFLRMGGHLSLAGHFLILAALYLTLHPGVQRRRLAWGALLAATALVHAYLLAMVALIWIADLAGRTRKGQLTRRTALIELLVLFLLVALCCWQAGYFSIGKGTVAGGFGLYRMNVLSLIDASGWSSIVPDLPEGPGDYEGFNFLGAGTLLAAIFAAVALLRRNTDFGRAVRSLPVLMLALVGLLLFALSNDIGLGLLNAHYPLPKAFVKLANIFRASGRMFWPVFYVIVFAIIYLVVRSNRPRTAVCLLAVALCVQVVDTRNGWAGLRQSRMMEPASEWATPLQDPFWKSAALHYANIRSLSPKNQPDTWQPLADFAATHGMKTDAAYLGRMSTTALEQAEEKATRMLQTGQYDPDSLYILDENARLEAVKTVNSATDLLTRIDGMVVLAPGWKQCARCLAVEDEGRAMQSMPLIKVGQQQLFNHTTLHLVQGWGTPEAWGTWSDGAQAEIQLRVPPQASSIVIDALAFVLPMHAGQTMVFSVNGVQALTTRLTTVQGNRIEIPITPAMREAIAGDRLMRIQVQLPDAISPKQLGLGEDQRVMGLGMKSLTVQ